MDKALIAQLALAFIVAMALLDIGARLWDRFSLSGPKVAIKEKTEEIIMSTSAKIEEEGVPLTKKEA